MKAFVIDVNGCSGCFECQIACKDEHCGNDWTPYAKPQPDVGHFWGRLNYYERGQTPHVKAAHVFVPCQNCASAPCIAACPVKGGIYERPDGIVIIDPKKCTGCQLCVDACPYGAIFYNAQLNLAQKCTSCAHLLDRGYPIKVPRCVDACPHEAIKFGEEADLKDLIAKAEVLHPEYGLKVRAYYIGLPRRFIAGTVYDPNAKEVIADATCTLTGEGVTLTAATDDFGDFWFEGIKAGTFSLKIEKAPKSKTISVSTVKEDISLGDIPLA